MGRTKKTVKNAQGRQVPSWSDVAKEIRAGIVPGYVDGKPNQSLMAEGKENLPQRPMGPMRVGNLPRGPPLPEKQGWFSNMFGKKKSAPISVLTGGRRNNKRMRTLTRKLGSLAEKGGEEILTLAEKTRGAVSRSKYLKKLTKKSPMKLGGRKKRKTQRRKRKRHTRRR